MTTTTRATTVFRLCNDVTARYYASVIFVRVKVRIGVLKGVREIESSLLHVEKKFILNVFYRAVHFSLYMPACSWNGITPRRA